jgi:hypothetical protein
MGQGHPRGKHQGGLITVALAGAAPPPQRRHELRTSLEFRLAVERAHLHVVDIAAAQLVKLLRGASIEDIPIEQPTKSIQLLAD